MTNIPTPKPALSRKIQQAGFEEETQDLITTDQAEAYKNACVREALEAAALVCEERSGDVRYVHEREVYACADAIRDLMPEQEQSCKS